VPDPTSCDCRPVSIVARDGEHIGVTWKFANRKPSAASRSRFGVAISDPKQPKSLNPTSSQRMVRMFGAPSGGVGRGGHHDVDSATDRPTPPWKPA
jgi:hypothetical protein